MSNHENHKDAKRVVDDLKEFFLDGFISESADDVVTIPREEYDQLIGNTAVLRIVRRVLDGSDEIYGDYNVLRQILGLDVKKLEYTIEPPKKEQPSEPGEEASE